MGRELIVSPDRQTRLLLLLALALCCLTYSSCQTTGSASSSSARVGPPTPSLVLNEWESKLRVALEGADRLQVLTVDIESRQKVLLDQREQAGIGILIDKIRINDGFGKHACLCRGDYLFRFYKGEYMVAELSFHHGKSLRWKEGWASDGILTPESAKSVNEFLDKKGIGYDSRAIWE